MNVRCPAGDSDRQQGIDHIDCEIGMQWIESGQILNGQLGVVH